MSPEELFGAIETHLLLEEQPSGSGVNPQPLPGRRTVTQAVLFLVSGSGVREETAAVFTMQQAEHGLTVPRMRIHRQLPGGSSRTVRLPVQGHQVRPWSVE